MAEAVFPPGLHGVCFAKHAEQVLKRTRQEVKILSSFLSLTGSLCLH